MVLQCSIRTKCFPTHLTLILLTLILNMGMRKVLTTGVARLTGLLVLWSRKNFIGDNEGVAYKVKYLRVSPSVTKQVFEPLAQLKYGYF